MWKECARGRRSEGPGIRECRAVLEWNFLSVANPEDLGEVEEVPCLIHSRSVTVDLHGEERG